MLLEEIKANLSSEEDVSSDEESDDDGKKKTGKPSGNRGVNGKHQIAAQVSESTMMSEQELIYSCTNSR